MDENKWGKWFPSDSVNNLHPHLVKITIVIKIIFFQLKKK